MRIQNVKLYSTKKTEVLFLEDKLYGMTVDKYIVKYKKIRKMVMAWVELNAKIYNLCLKHSPPDLELVLKANIRFIMGMLHVIWDIIHKYDNKMHRMMAYDTAFLEFSTTYQDPKQSNTD